MEAGVPAPQGSARTSNMKPLILLVLCLRLGSWGTQPDISVSRIETQMRSYLHDVTELPLLVHSQFVVTDDNGQITSRHQSEHMFTYEAGHSKRKTVDASSAGGPKPNEWELHADLGALITAYVFLPEQARASFTIAAPQPIHPDVIVKYRSNEMCSPWKKGFFGSVTFKYWCGSGNVVFSNQTLQPVSADFTAFPISPDGKGYVPGYKYEMTFQRVSIGSPGELFTVPKQVILTVKFKKKIVTVHNTFTLARNSK
jgi:hypothetical protein